MVYELVWKNQCLNCFTHACNGIDTHMHEKLHTLMHINTHTNDSVHCVHFFTPAAISALQREGCGSHLSVDSGFPFWIIAHTGGYILHTYINTHTHLHRRINRKQPKQTLDYTSHYSSRESHQSIWHEAWLSWKWGMLSHTLSLNWHHLHWCEPSLDHYLQTWLK